MVQLRAYLAGIVEPDAMVVGDEDKAIDSARRAGAFIGGSYWLE